MDWTQRTETSELCFTIFTQRSEVLHVVPPLESPKVMGLAGINHLNALHCFGGITYCPWCGKEGQNEGTMVNHLQTMPYRLGLVCNRCHDCPSITSDTLHCHGSRTVTNPGRTIPPSWFHPSNIQESTTTSAENCNKEVKMEWFT